METALLNINETTTKVNKLTSDQLAERLLPITKSMTISIIYKVDVSESKSVKGQKQLQKVVRINQVYLNHNYTNKVQNKTGEEFVARPLEDYGKTRISSTLIKSLKTDAIMIDGKVEKSAKSEILIYVHNGEYITESEAVSRDLFTPAYYNPAPKKTKGRGTVSTDDDFGIINTYLSRIIKVKIQGEIYKVV